MDGRGTRTRATFLGAGAVSIYVVLTAAAGALYPGSASPAEIFLSELGNADLNPEGSVLYNVGMIGGGLLGMAFFATLRGYFSEHGHRRLAKTASIIGVVNAFSVVMAGAVPEDVHLGVHVVWSMVIFLSFLPLLASGSVLLRRGDGFAKAVGLYGLVVCLADIGLLAALTAGGLSSGLGSVMEWVAVFAFLAWVALLSVDVWRTRGAQHERAGVLGWLSSVCARGRYAGGSMRKKTKGSLGMKP